MSEIVRDGPLNRKGCSHRRTYSVAKMENSSPAFNVRSSVFVLPGASLHQVTLRDSLFLATANKRVKQSVRVLGQRGISFSYRLVFLPSVPCGNPFPSDSKQHLATAFVRPSSIRQIRSENRTAHRSHFHSDNGRVSFGDAAGMRLVSDFHCGCSERHREA